MELRKLMILILTFFLVSCSEEDDNIVGYQAPDPPGQQLQQNMFELRIFSKFSDEPLFLSTNYEAVVGKISSTNSVYATFLDHVGVEYLSDHTINPTVEIANELKQVAFFAPGEYKDNRVEGSGIIVKGLVAEYSGQRYESMLVTGPTIRILVTQSFLLKTGTCRISSTEQIGSFAGLAESFIATPRLVVGTIKTPLIAQFEEYMRLNVRDFRLQILTDDSDMDYVPFIFGPLAYTYREHNVEFLEDQITSVTLHMEVLE